MPQTIGYAAHAADQPLTRFVFDRRELRPQDVRIDVSYCGVCHSDLHAARNEWGGTRYPIVPGHEIVGVVTAVGQGVSRFKAGDRVGVGCLVDSCRTCASCAEGLEQYCEVGAVGTYNGKDRISGEVTYGGYSKNLVVDEAFVLSMPDGLDLAAAAPLLCAGITTWSPLRHWRAGPGRRVGVVGIGGLGHMAIKFAHAFGSHVTVFTTTPEKAADARRLGAHEVVLSRDPEAMKSARNSLDLIIDTVAAPHDMDVYSGLLRRDGALVLVGLPDRPHAASTYGSLIFRRRSIAGSLIGGIAETQEMLDFCGSNGIVCDIEMIRMDEIEQAYARMLKSDVKYRFVIDLQTLA